MEQYTGRCHCGRIKIESEGSAERVSYCHCDCCRRSTGAPLSVYVAYPNHAVRYFGERPESFESSPGIHRSFCARCGTSIAYQDDRLPGMTYFHVGVFDTPQAFEPTLHGFFAEKLFWLELADHGERHPGTTVSREPSA